MKIIRPDVEMSLGEHLVELRHRIILALLGLLVGTTLCGIFYEDLLTAILKPYYKALVSLEKNNAPEPPPPSPESQPKTGTIPGLEPGAAISKAVEDRMAALEARIAKLEAGPGAANPPGPGAPAAGAPAKQPQSRLILSGPMTGYIMIILMCLITGVLVASPWVIYQIWAFVGVGLHPHERKYLYIYGPASFFLFIGGGCLFYFYILPIGLEALMSPTAGIKINGASLVDPSFMLEDYLYFVALMTLVFGIAFQTPLVVMFIERIGLVPLKTLIKQQRLVILIMVVIAALITPTVDPVSLTAMTVPLILLYEVGLLAAWLTGRNRRRLKAAEEAAEKAADKAREAAEEAADRAREAAMASEQNGENPYGGEYPYGGQDSTGGGDSPGGGENPYGSGENPGGGESPAGGESPGSGESPPAGDENPDRGGENPGGGGENPGGEENPPDDVEPMH